MNTYLKQSVDFIEGRTAPEDFESLIESDPNYLEWLQSIVPPAKTMYTFDLEANTVVQLPYKIITALKDCERLAVGGPKGSPNYRYAVHCKISNLIAEAFPELNLVPDPSYKDDFDLCLDACPMYIGGVEIAQANIIGGILASVPRTMSKTKRKKEVKARIIEAFHIEGKTYPRWIQEPEWPVYNGRPMRFLRTEKFNSEVRKHIFADDETGIERCIVDAF